MEKRNGGRAGTALRSLQQEGEKIGRERGPARAKPLDRGRQVVRLLTILQALERSKRGLTVQELIANLELNCTVRTVYRDIEHLQAAGIRLIEEDRRWRVDGQGIRSEPLTHSQMLALLAVEELLKPLTGHEVATSLAELRRSVRARLTPEGRAFADALRSTVALTVQAPMANASDEVMQAVSAATEGEQCLRIVHASPGKPARERIVEPHLAWAHQGQAYVVAYCREAQEFRTFAIQRIRSAEVLDEVFERRPFNPEEYTGQGFGVLRGPAADVIVRFTPEVAHLPHERRWHRTQEVTELPDGSCDVHMHVGGLPAVASWIASFGGKVRALAPPDLVDAVRALHEAGLAAHAAPTASRESDVRDVRDAQPRKGSQDQRPSSRRRRAGGAR